jgi:hypothetical protein
MPGIALTGQSLRFAKACARTRNHHDDVGSRTFRAWCGEQKGQELSDLWVGLVGIVVGTALSLSGSVIVNNLQLTKTMRIRLFDELLPRFWRDWVDRRDIFAQQHPDNEEPQVTFRQLIDIRRTAIIAGRKDAKLATAVTTIASDREEAHRKLFESGLTDEEREAAEQRFILLDLQLFISLEALRKYLERRLRLLN